MRASLRALIGLAVTAVGVPAVIAAIWFLGSFGLWVTHMPPAKTMDAAVADHVIGGFLTIIALGAVTGIGFAFSQSSWTEATLQAIERKIPKKVPPLSELISGAQYGSETRANEWAERY